MIIYQASKSQFLHHELRDDTEDVVSRQYRSATDHAVGPSEIQAWKHSLMEMAQVVGESMNRRIPNGAWSLFRANPAGTRQGKVIVVQHRSIANPETGGDTPSISTRARRCRQKKGDGGTSASRCDQTRTGLGSSQSRSAWARAKTASRL